MRKIKELLTPENVYIEYELAGIGSRMIAFAIDTLIQVLAILIIMIGVILAGINSNTINSFNSILVAIGTILVFLVYSGYFIFFEMLTNGQTPGKKIAKIRVIKATGEPIGFFESVIRNILRLIDVILSSYLAGAILIIFTKDCKRIGDFAANTIVVKVRKAAKLVTVDELLSKTFIKKREQETVNIYPVNEFEYRVLKEFMERNLNLGEKRNVLAHHLNGYFSQKFGVSGKYINPFNFFEDILKMNSNT